MARIRTIKPTHWADKELAKISLQAHLLWIALWNFSDDEGVFEGDVLLIKSQVFPRRTDIRTEQIQSWLDQLVKARFILPFTHKNEGYYLHRTFKAHQRIDKPQPSLIPNNVINAVLEHSTNDLGTVGSVEYSIGSSNSKGSSRVNGDSAAGAAGSNSDSKKEKPPTPHWQAIVKIWVDFYKEKFSDLEPSMNVSSCAALKSILSRLQKQSAITVHTKDKNWTEEYASKVFLHFLQKAYADTWRSQNFRLSILSSHYDSIITGNEHKPNSKAGRTEAANANLAGDLASHYANLAGQG